MEVIHSTLNSQIIQDAKANINEIKKESLNACYLFNSYMIS